MGMLIEILNSDIESIQVKLLSDSGIKDLVVFDRWSYAPSM
jgi:hypothetical protein